MKPLTIVWQRLVNSKGETCDRCALTYEALKRAVARLKAALGPLGMAPILEIKEIDEKSFKADPSASNKIWLGGKPLEDWLNAETGTSRCCSACGDSDCRTVEIAGAVFESIPENLILKAGLIAAAEMLTPKEKSLPVSSQNMGSKCCDDTA